MASAELEEIIKRAENLPPDEQLYLISRLADKARQSYQTDQSLPEVRYWRDLRVAAPYPLVGEDAQEWVTRTRHESEQSRGLRRSDGE